MGAIQSVVAAPLGGDAREQHVSPFEPFFDLVFAPTRVTGFVTPGAFAAFESPTSRELWRAIGARRRS